MTTQNTRSDETKWSNYDALLLPGDPREIVAVLEPTTRSIQPDMFKGAGLFQGRQPKVPPLPVLPPLAETLCQSCSETYGRPKALEVDCIARRHARMTRQQWERQAGYALPSKEGSEITLGPVPQHGS